MTEIHNIRGNLLVESASVVARKDTKKITLKGVVMRKGQISRNNILYDWESVIAHAEELIGRPLLYNHLNDSDKPPIGKVTNSYVEGDAWRFEADVNPNNEYVDSIMRGDLNNVSIQLIAAKAIPEKVDGRSYTRAIVGDLLELSVVPTPGFIDASIEMALAEAFRSLSYQEDQGTSNNPAATKLVTKKKEGVDMEAFHFGLVTEAREHMDLPYEKVAQIVQDHLDEDPNYYESAKQAEFYIVTLGVHKVREMIE